MSGTSSNSVATPNSQSTTPSDVITLSNPSVAAPIFCGITDHVDTGHTYKLINVASNLALTNSGGYVNGANVILAPLDPANPLSQIWTFVPAVGSGQRLMSGDTGMVLGLPDQAAGQTLLWADNATPDHTWNLTLVDPNTCTISISNNLVRQRLGLSHSANVADARVGVANSNNATFDGTWKLVTAGASWPAPLAVTTELGVIDPALIKIDNTYYLFSGGDGIQVQTSTDRLKFTNAGQVFAKLPTPISDLFGLSAELVTPDTMVQHGIYYLSYGIRGASFIGWGVATSPTGLAGSFTHVFARYGGSASSLHSRFFFPGDGNWFVTHGASAGGYGAAQIFNDQPAGNPNIFLIMRSAIYQYFGTRIDSSSGTIFKHDNNFYLFTTYFESQQAATQHIVVTRSPNFYTVPFVGRTGIDTFSSGGTTILASHENVVGPVSPMVFTDSDGDYLVYTYTDIGNGDAPQLGINRIDWSTGWPVLQ